MSPFTSLGTLCAKEALVLVRDRQALLLLFAMPALFVLILSLALEDIYNEKVGSSLPVALQVEDSGEFANRLVTTLKKRGEFRLVEADGSQSPEELLQSGVARAWIRVPAGFSQDAGDYLSSYGREPFGEYKLEWRASPLLDAPYRWSLRSGLSLVVLETILDSLVDPRGEFPDLERGADLFLSESESDTTPLPTPLQQTVPGWSLFAMFFIVVPLSAGLFRERTEGTLTRILVYPVPRSAVLLSKVIPYLLVGALQFACMLAVGVFVVPLFSDMSLQLGDNALVLLPITLACALAATSYALLVASLSKTAEQAAAFGATSVIILAMLGGVMIPHFAMPATLQQVALVSPLYWGHQAYLDAFLNGAGLAQVALPIGVLLLFATASLSVAALRLRR